MDSPTARPVDLLWNASPRTALHVVDVGANPIGGDAPYKVLIDTGYAQVTGFEPQAEALAALQAQKSPMETYLPHAVGDGRSHSLHMYRQSGFSSLFKINQQVADFLGFRRGTRLQGTVEVETVRLDDLDSFGLVDFLKIDVQGSELVVIANGRKKLAQAVAVQVEVRFVPLYHGEPSFGDVDAELRRQGFVLHDFDRLKRVALASSQVTSLRRTTNRQVVDGDAFYIRDLTKVDQLNDTQLWNLALLADAVMNNPQLVVFCLDHLVQRGSATQGLPAAYVGFLPQSARRA